LYDDNVVEWLETKGAQATPQLFFEYLKDVYSSPDMVDRFPDAVNLITNMIESLP
jgi:hypothetical protein